MSTMPATHGHSEACCNIPPVVTSGYQTKGTYEQIGGLKTYVTGPANATKAILVIYDIFGYFEQTLQGADILAYGDEHHQYKVLMPDWFEGSPCPTEWYPPNTEEKQKGLSGFFVNHPPTATATAAPEYIQAATAANPQIKSWGILGYCWGGKVVSLVTSASHPPVKVGAAIHPAMVDPKDAEGVSVPLVMLPSKDEPADVVKTFQQTLKVPNHVETFTDQVHGWMAARADLADPRVREEYTRGYKVVLEFFAKNWA